MPKCKYCGEPIEFITNTNRRLIPVNPVPVEVHIVQSKSDVYDRFYTESGEQIAGRPAKPFDMQKVKVYVPHKQTCEKWGYGDYRKKKRKEVRKQHE
jgi:hypothetical protein